LHSGHAALADTRVRPSAPRILVVEDNLVNQEVVDGFLQALGYHCEIVSGGEEALAAVREQRYDAVLMDCMMPDMDGFAATQAIRELEARGMLAATRLPIIALTAHALAGDRERCTDAGMDGYLSKPFTLESLAAELQRFLHRAEAVRPHASIP
jgi:CheY-like chemotaxis protein